MANDIMFKDFFDYLKMKIKLKCNYFYTGMLEGGIGKMLTCAFLLLLVCCFRCCASEPQQVTCKDSIIIQITEISNLAITDKLFRRSCGTTYFLKKISGKKNTSLMFLGITNRPCGNGYFLKNKSRIQR